MLGTANFKEVVKIPFKLPMGPWAADKNLKAIGYFYLEQFLDGLQGMAMGFYTRALGWIPQQVEVFLVDIRKDLKNPKDHSY
jgi:hypothetical protein